MNKRKHKTEWLRRTLLVCLTVVLAVTALYLPLDWLRVGQDAACLAAGLRQPRSAVAVLDNHLFTTSTVPVATTAPTDSWVDPTRGDTTQVDAPVAALSPTITMVDPPGKKKGGGTVVTRQMDTGNRKKGIATINRSGKTENIPAALAAALPVRFDQTTDPQVLILHTHTTEAYMTYDAGYYNPGDRERTKDHKRSVCAVGEAIRLTLAAEGIVAIHDTTLHDSPQYTGAYTRSATTAQAILEQYPSIRVVLDIHRDAVMESGAVVKPTATVEGKKAAQMMLITGTVTTDALPHPHWQKNLALATQLQAALDKVSPDLMRPLNTVASRYNQHLSPGWLLVEVGAEGNTVEEAVYSGQILARTLAKLLC